MGVAYVVAWVLRGCCVSVAWVLRGEELMQCMREGRRRYSHTPEALRAKKASDNPPNGVPRPLSS